MSASSTAAPSPSQSPTSIHFDALLLTSSNPRQRLAFLQEINIRRHAGLLPRETEMKVIVVADPDGVRIGSGGATLAALYALYQSLPGSSSAERLAKLRSLRIALFHSGGDSQRLPTCSVRGKAFCGLPTGEGEEEVHVDHSSAASSAASQSQQQQQQEQHRPPLNGELTPFDYLLHSLNSLLSPSTSGCIITATDCLFDFPSGNSLNERMPCITVDSPQAKGCVGFSILTSIELGMKHGVFVIDEEKGQSEKQQSSSGFYPITNILQKATKSELEASSPLTKKNQTVLLDSGIIFLSSEIVADLVGLGEVSPFKTCLPKDDVTASSGAASSLSSNEPTFRFELYTDILLPMNPSMTLSSYQSSTPADASYPQDKLFSARQTLYQLLSPYKCFVGYHPAAKFFHMGTSEERMEYMFNQTPLYKELRRKHGFRKQAHLAWKGRGRKEAGRRSQDASVINCLFDVKESGKAEVTSVLHPLSFLEYTSLHGSFNISRGSVVSGLRTPSVTKDFTIEPEGVCVQETRVMCGSTRESSFTSLSTPLSSSSSQATVLSIFHLSDSIKTSYVARDATFLSHPFKQLLVELAGVLNIELDTLVSTIWPTVKNDKEKTLWNAKLFPVIGDSRVYPYVDVDQRPEYAMWMLEIGKQGKDASSSTLREQLQQLSHSIQTWYHCGTSASPSSASRSSRLSFFDILALSDTQAEMEWRNQLAWKVDQVLLNEEFFGCDEEDESAAEIKSPSTTTTPATSRFAYLLRRFKSYPPTSASRSTLHDLLEKLAAEAIQSKSGRAKGAAYPRLDVAARIMWMSHELYRNDVEKEGRSTSAATSSSSSPSHLEPQLLTHLTTAQPSSWPYHLPHILSLLSSLRKENTLSNQRLAELYDRACCTVNRCATTRPCNTHYTLLPAAQHIAPTQTVSLSGCIRLDLFGGWTDTPPVCYEHRGGGCVLNVGICVEGKWPVRVEGKMVIADQNDKTSAPILIHLGSPDSSPSQTEIISLSTLNDISDYSSPLSKGALIKCTLVAMGIVDFEKKEKTLVEQLSEEYWRCVKKENDSSSVSSSTPSQQHPLVHLHLTSWIDLRGSISQGTGLGISSILAADLVLLLARLFNRQYSQNHILYLVLHIEQLLTTCGGWQDQVGGIIEGGFKLGRSQGGLPLRLDVEVVQVEEKRKREFESHLLFIHTGLPRLAKNLLRTVLDTWSSRGIEIVRLFDRLQEGAPQMALAVQRGEWKRVGEYFSEFWMIKRTLATSRTDCDAPPAEPADVTRLIALTKEYCYGASLAGAGGGGFLVFIAPPENHAKIQEVLEAFNRENEKVTMASSSSSSFTPCRVYHANVTDTCVKIEVKQ